MWHKVGKSLISFGCRNHNIKRLSDMFIIQSKFLEILVCGIRDEYAMPICIEVGYLFLEGTSAISQSPRWYVVYFYCGLAVV